MQAFVPVDPPIPSPTGPQYVTPDDPNDIVGPAGFGPQNFVPGDTPLAYTIDFENAATATAPTQIATITEQLDPNLNWNTFRLTGFGFDNLNYTLSGTQAFYSETLDLTATKGYDVNVTAGVNTANGLVTWTFTTIDPATGETSTLNPLTGFLPIDDANNDGQAYVSYTIQSKSGIASGSVVTADATVVFDGQGPINTPEIADTIDNIAPTSQVQALPAQSPDTPFEVSWSGQDDSAGSGIANYTIYVSVNGGPATVWLAGTTLTNALFTPVAGATYAFSSTAVDNVGNQEAIHLTADAKTSVGGSPGAPVLSPAAVTSVENGGTVSLGTAAAGSGNDPLSVSLTSDSDFATGSSITLTNGNLIYAPGLITAAQAGTDALNYTVMDTVTGATASETQTVTLSNGPDPVVSQASTPTAVNGQTATLGTASPGFGSDALSVSLTSDADFATGSAVNFVNGTLLYTPGLITAAQAGADALNYTVTDTVTGAITQETQTVPLSNGPAPIVTLATAPVASNAAGSSILGTAAPGFGSDALTVTLTSDADFASGSSVILSNGNLVYTPGLITAAKAGPDVLDYTVTDSVTGAVTPESQTVTLAPGTAPLVTLTSTPTATNTKTAILGTVSAANASVANDSFSVSLTSDADFATGSNIALTNGSLVYTPGLVTAAKVGSDTLNYTVTDTTNASTTQETQTVTLGNGPAPIVTLATAPMANNSQTTILGTVLAGFGNDPLAVTLTGDSVFGIASAGGSQLILSGGNLIYTPGLVTRANAGADTVSYTVTDTVTGAVTAESQSVSLDPGPQLTAGSLLIGHGQTENVTSLVNGLIKPGLPGDTETVVAASGGAILANGQITYTAPAAGGASSFGFTAQDQNGVAAQGNVAVTVDPGPSVAPTQAAVTVGQTVDLTSLIIAAASAGEPGDILTITADNTTGTKGSVTLSGGDLTYTASGAALSSLASGSSAADSFTYTLADQLGDTTSGTVTLTVTPPMAISVTGPAYGSGILTQTPGVTSLTALGYINTISATLGNATVNAGAGIATVNGGNNNLTVLFNGYFDNMTAGNGNDTISGSQGSANISLGGGNDGVTLGGYLNSLVAGSGNDTVSGGQGGDKITLGNGQDSVTEIGYSNVVTVGTGNDTIVAGAGFDTVKTGGGNDTITLSGYDNDVTAAGGNNVIADASGGGNSVSLGNGNDMVTLGGYGNSVTLSNGTSVVDAGAGNATIVAGAGSTDVTLHGYNNNVTLGPGTNTVNGGAGNDVIHLSGGAATLALGGFGDMVFLGGRSATITDTASYLTLGVSPGGTDIIQDFGAARGNVVDLMGGAGGFLSTAAVVQALVSDSHGGTLLTLGGISSIDFVGLAPQALNVGNFRIG